MWTNKVAYHTWQNRIEMMLSNSFWLTSHLARRAKHYSSLRDANSTAVVSYNYKTQFFIDPFKSFVQIYMCTAEFGYLLQFKRTDKTKASKNDGTKANTTRKSFLKDNFTLVISNSISSLLTWNYYGKHFKQTHISIYLENIQTWSTIHGERQVHRFDIKIMHKIQNKLVLLKNLSKWFLTWTLIFRRK